MLTWDTLPGDISGYKIYYGTSSGYLNPSTGYKELVFSDSNDHTEDIDWSGTGYWAAQDYHALSGIYTEFAVFPDTTAPVVTITSPTTGTVYGTETNSIIFRGVSSDDTGTSIVSWLNSRGGSGSANGTDNWSVSDIVLGEGENVITITARDAAGNTSIDTLTVTYTILDTTAPVVTITSPTSDMNYDVETSGLDIGGTALDAEGVIQVFWSNSRGGSGTASGTDNWSVSGIGLGEGENLIAVTVKDAAGNASADTLSVTYIIPDTNAPAVTITSPTTGTGYDTESDTVSLSGTSSDDTDISIVTWSNSRGGSGTAIGTDNWNVSGIALGEGENVITITARDEAGNAATDILTVSYIISYVIPPVVADTQPPVLILKKPTPGEYYFARKTILTLSGTTSDNIGVKEVRWVHAQGGSGVASGTSSWVISDVPLVRDWNNITIIAEDEAGNTTSHNLTVFLWEKAK